MKFSWKKECCGRICLANNARCVFLFQAQNVPYLITDSRRQRKGTCLRPCNPAFPKLNGKQNPLSIYSHPAGPARSGILLRKCDLVYCSQNSCQEDVLILILQVRRQRPVSAYIRWFVYPGSKWICRAWDPAPLKPSCRPLSAMLGPPAQRLSRYSWGTLLVNSGYQPDP